MQSKDGRQPTPGLVGMKAVVETLRGEDFPMEKRDIEYIVGNLEVEDTTGVSVSVRALLPHLEKDEFTSAEDIARALQSALGRSKKAA